MPRVPTPPLPQEQRGVEGTGEGRQEREEKGRGE